MTFWSVLARWRRRRDRRTCAQIMEQYRLKHPDTLAVDDAAIHLAYPPDTTLSPEEVVGLWHSLRKLDDALRHGPRKGSRW